MRHSFFNLRYNAFENATKPVLKGTILALDEDVPLFDGDGAILLGLGF